MVERILVKKKIMVERMRGFIDLVIVNSAFLFQLKVSSRAVWKDQFYLLTFMIIIIILYPILEPAC